MRGCGTEPSQYWIEFYAMLESNLKDYQKPFFCLALMKSFYIYRIFSINSVVIISWTCFERYLKIDGSFKS